MLLLILQVSLAIEPYLHHIPKTAGTSARAQLNEFGHWNTRHTECCFNEAAKKGKPIISFLREPVAQVFSQFLECKYDGWGKSVTEKTAFPRNPPDLVGFKEWLKHFRNSTDNFNCYHPFNMQTRSFAPDCTNSHVYLKLTRETALYATDRMLSLDAIGLTEHYRLSICIILLETQKKFPDQCKCDFKMKEKHESHGVPKHTVDSLDTETIKLIHGFIHYDRELYRAAQQAFWARVHALENIWKQNFRCLY